jgi:hypothetical protein
MTHTNPDDDGHDREGHDSQDKHDSDDASKDNEEPALTQEESVPTDGEDVDGENMMKSVRNELLQEPPPKA